MEKKLNVSVRASASRYLSVTWKNGKRMHHLWPCWNDSVLQTWTTCISSSAHNWVGKWSIRKTFSQQSINGSPADSLQHVILFFNGLKSNLNALAKVNLDYVLNNKLSNSFFAFPILDITCYRKTKDKNDFTMSSWHCSFSRLLHYLCVCVLIAITARNIAN